MTETATQRFWRSIDPITRADECWMWTAGRNHYGYGRFWVNGRERKAHRFAYELVNGPIPPGLHACHHCDVRNCVNPAHLFLGTQADNVQDMARKGRWGPPRALPKGEANHAAKLTSAQVLEIFASTESQYKLAAKFAIHQTTISLIKQGKNWRHVTGVTV